MLYRKSPTHGVNPFPGTPTIVFVTACTKNRDARLANDKTHEALCEVWREAGHWLVGKYVIMPDHVHFFAALTEYSTDFDSWMRYWKSLSAKRLGFGAGSWQREHWDTRMRTQQQFNEKWEYVQENPVRHGLVSTAEEWPYRGEIHRLEW